MQAKKNHKPGHRFLFNLETGSQLEAGSVLVAQPFWMEDIYRHSVILITDCDAGGCSGIIINKISNIRLYEILPEVKVRDHLYYGGPVTLGSYTYVHNLPAIPEADYFGNGIYFGGDPASVEDMITHKEINFEKIKFYSGTVEWDEGQLEAEMADQKWWLTKITAREIFGVAPADLWAFILRHSNHLYGMFAAEEMDPSLN
ncbi:MAG TPA: YqgE/AlgH family protein [Bacteroidia bacterium]|nr:YqgE/AlgH family protein [Bacteroidia bacterium]